MCKKLMSEHGLVHGALKALTTFVSMLLVHCVGAAVPALAVQPTTTGSTTLTLRVLEASSPLPDAGDRSLQILIWLLVLVALAAVAFIFVSGKKGGAKIKIAKSSRVLISSLAALFILGVGSLSVYAAQKNSSVGGGRSRSNYR